MLKTLYTHCRRRLRDIVEKLGYDRDLFARLRRPGLRMLRGGGIEIGAFEHPAPVPRRCRIEYVDVITPAQAKELFPEIDETRLVPVDHLVDIDAGGLGRFDAGSQDFVIACHVIEHVANPGRFVGELLRMLRPGGLLVIAAPDRDYTFDRNRPLTPQKLLERYFRTGRSPIGPEDYREVLTYVCTEQAGQSTEMQQQALEGFFRRREHLSVWTAESFREFLISAYGWNGVRMEPLYEVLPDRNRFEYFGVWKKTT